MYIAIVVILVVAVIVLSKITWKLTQPKLNKTTTGSTEIINARNHQVRTFRRLLPPASTETITETNEITGHSSSCSLRRLTSLRPKTTRPVATLKAYATGAGVTSQRNMLELYRLPESAIRDECEVRWKVRRVRPWWWRWRCRFSILQCTGGWTPSVQ